MDYPFQSQFYMNFQTHKKQLLKNPAFAKAYAESEREYQVARMLIKARLDRGYTQADLARVLHTQQSVISRAEQAKTVPSLSFLKKAAKALDVKLLVELR